VLRSQTFRSCCNPPLRCLSFSTLSTSFSSCSVSEEDTIEAVISQIKRKDKADSILVSVDSRFKCSALFWNCLIARFAEDDFSPDALFQVISMMQSVGLQPDVKTLNAGISGYLSACHESAINEQDLHFAEMFLDRMSFSGIGGNFETLGLFLRGYVLANNVCKLRDVVGAMKDPHREGDPSARDPSFYRALIESVGQKGDDRLRIADALAPVMRHWKVKG